jgi:hypothetical protein
MTFSEFTALVSNAPDGVILLEGRRAIPAETAAKAEAVARLLARHFPQLRFRSGNAEGSDEAFTRGIASVDPTRLQIVAPYASHRKSARHPDATYDSPDSLSSAQEAAIAYKTSAASPKNQNLIAKRKQNGPLAAKAAYLIRDTMKVTGHSEEFPKPVCALFYVNMDDPLAGGTGHTIRVCQQEGVPYAFQDCWSQWPTE